MEILTVIFIGCITFLIGFFVGVKKEPPIKFKKQVVKPIEAGGISREYENFLNYDGSEQL